MHYLGNDTARHALNLIEYDRDIAMASHHPPACLPLLQYEWVAAEEHRHGAIDAIDGIILKFTRASQAIEFANHCIC